MSQPPYQLVMFDFDGTLADSFAWTAQIANTIAVKHRRPPISPDEQELFRSYSASQVLRHLRIPWWRLPGLAREYRNAMARDIESIPLFPGVAELLPALAQRGLTLAMVSSNTEPNIRKVFGPNLAAHIRYFECGIGLWGKADKIKKILRHSRIAVSTAILIGDEIRDGESAHQAKVAFGAVAWGYTRLEALQTQTPEVVFHQVADMRRVLLGE